MNFGESFSPALISNCVNPKSLGLVARLMINLAQRLHVIGNKGDRHDADFAHLLGCQLRIACDAARAAATGWRPLCSDSTGDADCSIRRVPSAD